MCAHRQTHTQERERETAVNCRREKPSDNSWRKHAEICSRDTSQRRGEKERGVKKGGHRGKRESRESVSGQHVSHTVLYFDRIAFHLFIWSNTTSFPLPVDITLSFQHTESHWGKPSFKSLHAVWCYVECWPTLAHLLDVEGISSNLRPYVGKYTVSVKKSHEKTKSNNESMVDLDCWYEMKNRSVSLTSAKWGVS